MTESLRDILPEKLAEIAEIIGVDAALTLSKSFPGIRIFVPKHVRGDSVLVAAIGIQAARKLSRHYDGESIVVPMAKKVHQLRIKALVLKLLGEGKSAPYLARKYGVHQFTIYRWSAESMSASQMALFSEPV